VDVAGVSVCDDAAYFDSKIAGVLDQAVGRWDVTAAVRERARWRIVDGWKGLGYAKTTPAEKRVYSEVAAREGLLLDPVYTGKAFLGLQGEARAGRLASGSTLFLHTGGLFGLFA
jgi:D-cysteine desulfhydrase